MRFSMVTSLIYNDLPNLVIVRGVSGSGKTTFSESINVHYEQYEADQYFVRPDGVYDFNPRMLKNAHAWCKSSVQFTLNERRKAVVSNTFTQFWEIEDYIKMVDVTQSIAIVEMKTQYQNVHGVPEEVIKKMTDRFESNDVIAKEIEKNYPEIFPKTSFYTID